MIIFPRKMKFKKYQKQKRRFILDSFETKYIYPKNFFYGVKLKKCFRIFDYHMETIKILIKRKIKIKAKKKFIFGFFPDLSITKKSSGLRMGKGKGNIFKWTTILYGGRIFCELKKNFTLVSARKIVSKLKYKLPKNACKLILRKKFYNY